MIIAFVGCIDNESQLPITGTGKTCAMTGYAYLEHLAGKTIYTNYYTDFSIQMGFQEIIERFGDIEQPDTIVCITEMSKILDAVGSSTKQVMFIDRFAKQLRKLDVDVFWDDQRFNSIHKRLRIHTDVVLMTYKTHMDNKPCKFNRCMADHKIYVYQIKPKPILNKWLRIFSAPAVGKHYNSKEFINDCLTIK